MDTAGVLTLVAIVVLVVVIGAVARTRSGRVRTAAPAADGPDGWALVAARPTGDDRVLLLQLSSPVCTPCRQTAEVLRGLADDDSGLRHVEVDVADRADVARALGVLRTPVTVAFDRAGVELLRVSGVPRADDLRGALRPAGPDG